MPLYIEESGDLVRSPMSPIVPDSQTLKALCYFGTHIHDTGKIELL